MNPHRLQRSAILAALAFAIAGCGGGGSAPITHAQLVERANALCGARELDLDALRALRPPPDDVRIYRRYLAAVETLLETDDPVELAAAQGKADGYALRLGLMRCARRHNSPP